MARLAFTLVCLMVLIIPSLSWNMKGQDSSSDSSSRERNNRRTVPRPRPVGPRSSSSRGQGSSSDSSSDESSNNRGQGPMGRSKGESNKGRSNSYRKKQALSAALKKKEAFGFYTTHKAFFVFKKVSKTQAEAADVCEMYGMRSAHFVNAAEMNEVCVKFLINQLKVNRHNTWTGYKYSKGRFTFNFKGKRNIMGYKLPRGSYDKCSCSCSSGKDSDKYFYYSPCFSKMSDSVAKKIVTKGDSKKTCLAVKNDKLYAHGCGQKFFVLCRAGCK